ncbi:FKBP-type peptidyl-prolyl cis-trans isomerase [Rosenbergiella australiborealis]|uniref:Peptidyl-prolyl cis-trans isomerase n=1 Tax=Rosenbergiella australiborealis TaxID=1544696 RepID=A0ABS5T1C2_9GAMM|nr:FKBP-type peptidyl-prolyl cis-trans isomerase [Rosenbergiella australiborealis]MBT0726142.1 FKBP-type peptidyl-prolyl cis-trans isomerase [Rosenbergiella australiborealis]
MSELTVTADSRVLAQLVLTLADGSVAESTRVNNKPALLTLGDQSLSPKLEAELMGLTVGSQHKFSLAAEDAFGPTNPDLVQYFSRQAFLDAGEPEVGTIMLFGAIDGSEMPGIIREVSGDSITVDFNHPLAGHDISFDIEIVEINPVLEEQNENLTG